MERCVNGLNMEKKMNWKTWSLLILALVAGSLAAYGIKAIFFVEHASGESDKVAISGLKEQLLVANGDLSAGTELNALNVRLTITPENAVPRDGIFSFNGVSGRKVSRDLKDGEPISLYDLDESEQSDEATAVFVPPGCSVVPIEISSATKENGNRNYLKTTKLNKMIKTGDSVDVIVVKEVPSKSGPVALPRLATETIAQNVSVFSVTDESRFSSDGVVRTSTISTLLTSDQLERIREASEEGKIRIVLHGDAEGNGAERPSSVFESEDSSSADSHYPQFERPRVSSPVPPADAQPFVIGLNTEETNGSVDMDASDTSSLQQKNDTSDASSNTAVPGDGFINRDFTIDLDEAASEEVVKNDSEQPGSIAVDEDSSVRWNSVDFNSPYGEGFKVKEDSVPLESNWLGPRSFRSRDLIDEDLNGATVPYERAASDNLTSEPSVVGVNEPTGGQPVSDKRKVISAEKNKATNVSGASSEKNAKKYSPFVTVSSKQSGK